MIFVFTTSNMIGSRLIEWGLGTEYSHFAIGETNLRDAFVIDSNFGEGVKLSKLSEFEKKFNVVHILEIPEIDNRESQRIFNKIHEATINKKYDWKAILFFGIIILFRKIFRMEISRENKWASREEFFCSEILDVIRKDLELHGVDFLGYEKQMLSPDIAFKILSNYSEIKFIKRFGEYV